MARLTFEQWGKVRADYEVHKLNFERLSEKYKIDKSNISRKAKKEGWNQEQTQHLLKKTSNAINDIKGVLEQTQHFNDANATAFVEAVNEQLEILSNIQTANALRSKIYKAASHHALKKTLEAIQLDDSEALSDSMKLLTVGNTAIAPVHKSIEIQQKDKQKQDVSHDNKSISVEFIDASQA